MEDKSAENNATRPEEKLNPLLADLYYPSESDEPISFVTGPPAQEGPLTEIQIKEWLQLPAEKQLEERPEEDFWTPVTEEKDWYGDEEKAQANRFKQVRTAIEQLLTDRQVFRVGETEIDLYLLGRQTDGSWAGLKTLIVET